ncbi:hypothetical protein Stsp02_11690 [Streptomyces sp. NBRC 14336]|uniref:hypothetical protein n=1 Tax=Streptomyces sp. NBRC 14336 TaxID=3030992 RepID=UPI0024A51F83|nr:hypothetical protein [Streptomyces sp. NBRC 14336]GLW45507.1 hypothetical protein Stsp02_11690 [Streptomyces sp. NBRC 14336]
MHDPTHLPHPPSRWKRDPLLWAALAAVLVVLASAEYQLAVACGFGRYVAAGVPAALDVYALAALRARRDVLTVVLTLIAVNAASHLVAVGLLPVSVPLVVAVSAVAPLVLWRVHRLSERHPEPAPTPVAEPGSAPVVPAEPAAELPEQVTVERDLEPADAIPAAPVLGPWQPLAELASGTGGTALDLHEYRSWGIVPEPTGTAPEPVPVPVPPPVPPTGTGADDIDSEDTGNTTFAARVATVRQWLESEPELTGSEIGTRLGVSDGYGRRLLRTARDGT